MSELMKLPVEVIDQLSSEEMLFLCGGMDYPILPNNINGTCDGVNNASGSCGLTNNGSGTCGGTNNKDGSCGGINNGSGVCGH